MKRTRVTDKALRLIVGQLISSDLTMRELSEISRSFFEGDFGGKIGFVLREFVYACEEFEPPMRKDDMSASAREAYQIIQRRKLSKASTLSILKQILGGRPLDERQTVRQLLIEFFDTASPKQKDALLNYLGPNSEDKYLKGITSR